MTLEWILTKNGIDPDNDLTIDTSISFAAMSGSFISGIGDYVSLFEHSVYIKMQKKDTHVSYISFFDSKTSFSKAI